MAIAGTGEGANTSPELSVVLVARDRFDVVRRTVAALRTQTILHQIELLIVTVGETTIADRRPDELQGFARVQLIFVGPFKDVDKASAEGFLRASAPVVAHMEDHVFPDPDWAEAVLDAHRGPWAAVGGKMINANPATMLSWANILISHMAEVTPRKGEATRLSTHNATYKTKVLEAYGERLAGYLGRDGGLMRDLIAKGHKIYVDPCFRFQHQQMSVWRAMIAYRVNAGRNWAAARVNQNDWSWTRRLLYAVGGPLIPLVRLVRLVPRCRELGVYPRVIPTLFAVLALDAVGEMIGYVAGTGRSLEIMAEYEVDRPRFMSHADREQHQAAIQAVRTS